MDPARIITTSEIPTYYGALEQIDFQNEGSDKKSVISRLKPFFPDQFPTDEVEQNRFVCLLCEQIASKQLKDLLKQRTNSEQYYKTLTKFAAIHLLFTTGETLPPQCFRRFDIDFNYLPNPTLMQRAKLKVFMSCQFVLKNKIEEKQMPTVDFKYKYKNQTFKAKLFDGLAWTFVDDLSGYIEDRRIRGVEAFRLSEERVASDPFYNDHPWNENLYERVEFPASDMDYWKKQMDQYLLRASLLTQHPQPTEGVPERLIGKITYATARFHLWGDHTDKMLSFQAKVLSDIFRAKFPQSTPSFYQHTLVRGENSFCDDVYLPSIAGKTIPDLPENMGVNPLREIMVGDFRSDPHKDLLIAFWTLPTWVKKDYEEASKVYQQFSKATDTQKALMDVQNWVSRLTEERKKAEYSSALVLHFVVAPLYKSILPHL